MNDEIQLKKYALSKGFGRLRYIVIYRMSAIRLLLSICITIIIISIIVTTLSMSTVKQNNEPCIFCETMVSISSVVVFFWETAVQNFWSYTGSFPEKTLKKWYALNNYLSR